MRLSSLLIILFAFITPAQAQDIRSEYSSVDVKKCKFLAAAEPGEGEWAQWRCRGYDGRDVYVMEGDLRFFITFQKSDDGRQTLAPFNTIGKNLEWRLKNYGGQWEPFATILRYYTGAEGTRKGQILVVSKYDQGVTCHVAYVDALANKQANQLARTAADEFAENFDCKNDKVMTIGKSGVSPM